MPVDTILLSRAAEGVGGGEPDSEAAGELGGWPRSVGPTAVREPSFQGSTRRALAPVLARNALPGGPGVGDRHGPERRAELLRMRERLAKHGLGKHWRQHERIAVQDAVAECHCDRRTADVDGVVVDDSIWTVAELPA